MPLSWNEIKSRARAFSRKWEGETSERAEAQSFWNDFFGVFGIERRRVAVFEKQVRLVRAGEHLKRGRIDAFWKGMPTRRWMRPTANAISGTTPSAWRFCSSYIKNTRVFYPRAGKKHPA